MIDLKGATILVTRPMPQAMQLCSLIKKHNGEALNFPTLAFEDIDFSHAMEKLSNQDWLIFISPQAVYSFNTAITKKKYVIPPHIKIAAIGKGTADALHQAGYEVAFFPKTNKGSEEFLAHDPFTNPQNLNMAIIRGEGGRELIDAILAERFAKILTVMCYRRMLPDTNSDEIIQLLRKKKIDAIVGTSFEGIKNLKILIGADNWSHLKNVPLCVPSERIKKLAQQQEYATIWVTSEMSDNAILQTLAKQGIE